jgi:hypothetical protein
MGSGRGHVNLGHRCPRRPIWLHEWPSPLVRAIMIRTEDRSMRTYLRFADTVSGRLESAGPHIVIGVHRLIDEVPGV